MTDEQTYPGNVVWNKKGDSLTVYISDDITLSKGDKLYAYRSKKGEDAYGRAIYYLTNKAREYKKKQREPGDEDDFF